MDNVFISGELMIRTTFQKDFTKALKAAINVCDIKKGMFGNFIVKIVQESLRKYSNWMFECPQKTGHYYAYNFEVFDNYIPTYFLGRDGYFFLDILGKLKTGKKKMTVNLLSLKILGSYVVN